MQANTGLWAQSWDYADIVFLITRGGDKALNQPAQNTYLNITPRVKAGLGKAQYVYRR